MQCTQELFLECFLEMSLESGIICDGDLFAGLVCNAASVSNIYDVLIEGACISLFIFLVLSYIVTVIVYAFHVLSNECKFNVFFMCFDLCDGFAVF